MARAGTAHVLFEGDFRKLNRAVAAHGRQYSKQLGAAMHSPAGQAAMKKQAQTIRQVGTAAKWTAGVGLVALGVETKRAVAEWRESVKAGRQTEAVLKSTGGQAKITARDVELLANKISLKAGIDDEAIQSAENLLLTFTKVRDETGKGNQIFSQATSVITDMSVALDQDLKSSTIQVGKALQDPIKGITALRRVGVNFTAEQAERIKGWVEEGKQLKAQKFILRELKTEFGGSAAAQADAFDKAKVGVENLEESLGRIVGPPLSGLVSKVTAEVLPSLDKLSGRLDKIWSRKDIDLGEKLKLSRKAAQPLIDQIGRALDRANLGEKLSHAVEVAVPKIAEAAAKAAPKAVRAFFNAWRGSNLWGKLVIGGFLLQKMGGFAAFRALGRQSGTAMGSGIADGAAGTATKQLPGRFGALRGRMRAIGKFAFGTALIAGATDAVTREGLHGLGDRWQQFSSTATLGLIPAPRDIDERMGTIARRIQSWRSSGRLALNRPGDPTNSLIRKKDLGDFDQAQKTMLSKLASLRNAANRLIGPGTRLKTGAWANPGPALKDFRSIEIGMNKLRNRLAGDAEGITRVSNRNLRLMARNMNLHSREGRQAVEKNMRLTARAISEKLNAGEISATAALRAIRRSFRVHTKASKDSAQTNFNLARDAIRRAVNSGKVSASDGLREIRRLFREYLGTFGIKGRAAEVYLGRSRGGKFEGLDAQGVGGHQRGAVIVPGSGSGDTVPALLEPGEVVWNRKAVKHYFGSPQAANVANKTIPRFQTGGTIPRQVVHGPGFGQLQPGVQAGLDRNVDAANKKLKQLIAEMTPPAGGGSTKGPKGIGTYAGLRMANWVIDALRYAASKGVAPQPTSGYRSHAENVAHGRFYFSEHEGTQYPHGAVDFGGFTSGLAQKMSVVAATAGFKYPLLAPIGFSDDGHASGTGHQRGGMIGMQKGGATARLSRSGPGGIPFKDWGIAQKWGGRRKVDPLLLAAIGLHETGWGKLGDGRRGNILGVGSFDTGSSYKWAGVENQLREGSALLNKWGAHNIRDVMAGKAGSWATDPRWESSVNTKWHEIATPYWRKHRWADGGGGATSGPAAAPKKRPLSKRTKKLLKRYRGIGLPKATERKLKRLTDSAAIFDELANRAQTLTSDDGGAAKVGGFTEAQWLSAELKTLFELRNTLIRAHDSVVRKRQKITGLLERYTPKAKLDKAIKRARRHPHRNRKLIRFLTSFKEGYKKIVPALKKSRSGLNTRRGELLTSLEEVQGIASPMGVLKSLPQIGTVGGSLFDVQTRLRDLGKKPEASDTTTTDTTESESAELLRTLLQQSNLRYLVSQRQYPELAGSFGGGGVVPGPVGSSQVIEAHGREGVFTPEQMAAMGTQQIVVQVLDGAVDPNKIRVIAHGEAKTVIRHEVTRVNRTPALAGVR